MAGERLGSVALAQPVVARHQVDVKRAIALRYSPRDVGDGELDGTDAAFARSRSRTFTEVYSACVSAKPARSVKVKFRMRFPDNRLSPIRHIRCNSHRRRLGSFFIAIPRSVLEIAARIRPSLGRSSLKSPKKPSPFVASNECGILDGRTRARLSVHF